MFLLRFFINEKKYINMKKLIETLEKDLQSENFTLKEIVVYGLLTPVAFLAACLVAELINSL